MLLTPIIPEKSHLLSPMMHFFCFYIPIDTMQWFSLAAPGSWLARKLLVQSCLSCWFGFSFTADNVGPRNCCLSCRSYKLSLKITPWFLIIFVAQRIFVSKNNCLKKNIRFPGICLVLGVNSPSLPMVAHLSTSRRCAWFFAKPDRAVGKREPSRYAA